MSNIFKKAKTYQRKHPRTSWQDSIKAVSRKKKTRRVGTVKRKSARPRRPARPRTRAIKLRPSAAGKSLSGIKSQARMMLKDKLARELLNRDLTKGVRKKRKMTKQINQTRKQLKQFS